MTLHTASRGMVSSDLSSSHKDDHDTSNLPHPPHYR